MCSVVLSTIELDYKAGAVARKIREVRTDGRLTTKVRAVHRQMPQLLPQDAFGIRRLVAHRTSARYASITFPHF
jgi:hypothetical protein